MQDFTAWMIDQPEFQAEAEAIVEAEIKAAEDSEAEKQRWHCDFK